jgi:hypothetical protein
MTEQNAHRSPRQGEADLGERIRALEVQFEMHAKAVGEKLDRGAAGFEKIRESIMDLTAMVRATHAACIKAEDLQAAEQRVEARVETLETFRDRVKRYGTAISVIGGTIIGGITLFGPSKIAAAFKQLWG